MEITESRTLEGLPRVDWIQIELVYRPQSKLFQLGLFLVTFVGTACVASYIWAVRDTDANHMYQFELNFFLGLIFTGWLALPVYLIALGFYAYHNTKGVDRIGETSYCRHPVACFMFLKEVHGRHYLCFISGDTRRALCSNTPDRYESIRLEELASFMATDENDWEGVRVNPALPQERLIIADRGERGTVTMARHYGSKSEINLLRTALHRNFLDRSLSRRAAAAAARKPSDDVI